MTPLRIYIPGKPVTYKRTRGSGKRRFTDPVERQYRQHVQSCAVAEMLRTRHEPFPKGMPLRADFAFHCVDYKWGDLSNYIKCIEDALNKVAFYDDKQIRSYGYAVKRIADGAPYAVAIFRPFDPSEEPAEWERAG